VAVATFGSFAKARGTCIVVMRLRKKQSTPKNLGVVASEERTHCTSLASPIFIFTRPGVWSMALCLVLHTFFTHCIVVD
jgi:hypothetical protein